MLIINQDQDQFFYANQGMFVYPVPKIGYTIFAGTKIESALVLGTYDTLRECIDIMQGICAAYEQGDHHYTMPGFCLERWEDWDTIANLMTEDL